MQNKKSITLIIGGGIAAYKGLELIRRLAELGIKTVPVLTKAGSEFVTPLSLATLAGNQVHMDLFDLENETEIGHIQLSRQSDLVVVAPATADLMAKCTGGLSNDLASTLLLATDKPVLMAPAMNVKMWEHPATQRNFKQLQQDGIHFIGPENGPMACGETGPGRMVEVETLLKTITNLLAPVNANKPIRQKPLAGKKVLITAGPTHEPIDPVRYIANRSSGKQGYALAIAAREMGANVTLISGPTKLDKPAGVDFIAIETARDMLKAAKAVNNPDIVICAAAVADWRVKKAGKQKLKKSAVQDGQAKAQKNNSALPKLKLKENPDILKTLAKKGSDRAPLVIGFAAETENVLKHATAKLKRKKCDWIVANDVSAKGNVFGNDQTTIHILTKNDVETHENISKAAAAGLLLQKAAEHLSATGATKENKLAAE